jgi:hypothetical protein
MVTCKITAFTAFTAFVNAITTAAVVIMGALADAHMARESASVRLRVRCASHRSNAWLSEGERQA